MDTAADRHVDAEPRGDTLHFCRSEITFDHLTDFFERLRDVTTRSECESETTVTRLIPRIRG